MQILRGIVAAAAILVAGSSLAQEADFRPNPFRPPPSEQEKQLIQDERTRNIVRGMQSEIVDKVAVKFERKIDTMEQSLKQKVDEAVRSATSNLAPATKTGEPNSKETENAKSLVPEGAAFVACVNKKALYRDKDNTLIQDASDSNRCVAP
jgi:hypothetical protein